MNVLLFGATGMVGQGILRECLLDATVERVQVIGRTPTAKHHPKLKDTVHRDSWNYADIEADLTGFDACFFALGVSSVGMKAEQYERITYDITMAAAETLCRLNPQMTFLYISGAGTDNTERGKSMWARVKGKTENALLRLPFAAAYMFRPGVIQPLHGVKSKTTLYRVIYTVITPLLSMMRRTFPNYVLTTEEIGRAMLKVARGGYSKKILETVDIRAVLRQRAL
jgi:uncharacterized protein YbjT (DUF2867 family)